MALTTQQIRFFRDTGFLKIPGCISDPNMAEMKRVLAWHVQNRVEPCRTNANGDVVRLDALISRDPVFLNVLQAPPLANALRAILGPNIELKLNRHNHLALNARGDNKYRLHRDVLQWTRGLVTAIIYLEEATVDNGCTYVVPTSQFLPCAGVPDNGVACMDEHEVFAELLGQAIPVPMPAGSVLLLDGRVFHSVGENRTHSTRQSICLALHSVDELSGESANKTSEIVLGERAYRGNDSIPALAFKV